MDCEGFKFERGTAMAKMTGFVFQDKYLDRVAKLSDEELGRLVRALAQYHSTGETQDLDGRESIAYDFIKEDIDEIEERYTAKCEQNKRNRTSAYEKPQLSTDDNDRQRSSTNAYKENIKEKIIEIKDNVSSYTDTPFGEVEVDPVIVALQRELNGLTQSHYEDLDGFRKVLDDDLIMEAINEAVAHSARSWAYVRTILQTYVRDGIRTVGQARERSAQKKDKFTGKKVTAQLYEQRHYTEEELENRVDSL